MSHKSLSCDHWGEICDPSTTGGMGESEWEQVTSNRPIELEAADRHQPSTHEFNHSQEVPPSVSEMDPYVLHTVRLVKYGNTLCNLIDTYHEQLDDSPVELPPFPEGPVWKPRNEYAHPFNFLERKLSDFALGERKETMKLSGEVCRQILRKSCATIFAHAGYDTAKESALDTVTDLADEYLKKMVLLLRHTVDNEALFGPSGFPDVMERVFHEMGLGSMLHLHDFYLSCVIRRHERVSQWCQQLFNCYETLKLQPPPTPVIATIAADTSLDLSQDMENGDEDEDVPEIHFPAPEDGDEAFSEHAQQTLEPGFQMLQSLEQEAAAAAEEAQANNINNCTIVEQDSDEIINVNDSPSSCQDNPPSVALSDESPQGRQAKKRKKK